MSPPQKERRLRWEQLPEAVRSRIESIAGGRVVAAANQPAGFSPGLASRLTLAGGGRVFAKAISGRWPVEAGLYRSEAAAGAGLPAGVPAPRLRGAFDDGDWVGLVFDDVDGHEPARPWAEPELRLVLVALAGLARTTAPDGLGDDQPRLGGWSSVSGLPALSPWAANRLPLLRKLERVGLAAARGAGLVHFDLYPHNVVVTRERAYVVDWPHARRGNSLVDLVSILSTVEDPDRYLPAGVDARTVDGLIAAHAGFCVAGALSDVGRPAIRAAKRDLAAGYLAWLARRLS